MIRTTMNPFRRTLRALRKLTHAGGCQRHSWCECFAGRSVGGRYEFRCERCPAAMVIYADGYGRIERVYSPASNPRAHADPQAEYLASGAVG